MAILNISAVLYALGWALLHSLWQMGTLWIVYQLFLGIPKKWSPTVKHNGSLILLFIGFAWFLVTGMSSFQEYILVKQYVNILPSSESNIFNTMAVQESGTAVAIFTDYYNKISETTLVFLEDHVGKISVIYLFVLIIMMFRFTNAYLYANQIKKKGLLSAGYQLENRVAEWSLAMGIQQQVQLFLSQRIDVPATIGFLKPVILLPVASVNQLSLNQVESIIMHELAHIRRLDYLWNILASVIETILFFNPFVYLLTSVQKKERELCCDDFVLGFSRDPHNYATALLELEKTRMIGKPILAMASNGQDGQLLSRVKRILNLQTDKLQYRQRFIALFFITTLMSTLGWLQPVQWKKENQAQLTLSMPASQWMLENKKPSQTVSDLVKKQVSFDKTKTAPVKKPHGLIEKKLPEPENQLSKNEFEFAFQENPRLPLKENMSFGFNTPPAAEFQQLQNEMNDLGFQLLQPEIAGEFIRLRETGPVYINQAPQVKIQEQFEELEKQYKKYENTIGFHENLSKEFGAMQEMRSLDKKRTEQTIEKAQKRIINKKAPQSNMIFINGKSVDRKIILDGEENYLIRIETDDESIVINVGTDSLRPKVIKTPRAATARRITTEVKPVTIHSADTYPHNRY